MKLKTLRIENFRAFRDQTVDFDDYTSFVGPNGAGKSTILTALNVFFRENPEPNIDLATLTEEDFHKKNTSAPIKITLTFSGLSPDEQNEFKHYYRQSRLVLMAQATWDAASKSAPVVQYGSRNVMADFASYFEAIEAGKKAAELKPLYADIRTKYLDLPNAATLDAMKLALRTYEEEHPELCELRDSADELYGVSKGANRLQKFVQWVYIPPVKFASDEQTEAKKTAIGQLLDKVVRSKVSFREDIQALRTKILLEYNALVIGKQSVLDEVSSNLCKRLQSWTTPGAKLGMKWSDDDANVKISEPMAQVLAGDDAFLGSLTRMGHGLQRAYLIALLEELAALSPAEGTAGPKLLLACEEPELHQHPPQQRHFMRVFERLAGAQNQVMVTTHSPYFVSGCAFESVRMVRLDRTSGASVVSATRFDDVAAKLAEIRKEAKPATPSLQEVRLQQALQPALSEMFFSPVVVFVEGLEDVAYLTATLILTDKWDRFRQLGCHLVPVGGKSELLQPAIIAEKFGIPAFLIFDADGDKVGKPERRAFHQADNERLLAFCGRATDNPFPPDTRWDERFIMWKTDIRNEILENLGGGDALQILDAAVRKQYGIQGDGDIKKHELLIGYMLQELQAQGKMPQSLLRACEHIIAFAEKAT